MKFAKYFALVALAIAALGISACAKKETPPPPPPAPPTTGYTKSGLDLRRICTRLSCPWGGFSSPRLRISTRQGENANQILRIG